MAACLGLGTACATTRMSGPLSSPEVQRDLLARTEGQALYYDVPRPRPPGRPRSEPPPYDVLRLAVVDGVVSAPGVEVSRVYTVDHIAGGMEGGAIGLGFGLLYGFTAGQLNTEDKSELARDQRGLSTMVVMLFTGIGALIGAVAGTRHEYLFPSGSALPASSPRAP